MQTKSCYSHLNPEQQRAVRTSKGRILILAGAGSGKTSVLTHRIAYLIQEENVDPSHIIGLTFTNKAAEEMRERVAKLVGPIAKKITLSTFHSYCMKVLRNEIELLGYAKNFSLYNERDVKRLLDQLASDLLEHPGELPPMEKSRSQINLAKSKGISTEDLTSNDQKNHAKFTNELFNRLQVSLRAYNAVDFDSLLTLTIDLFRKFPEVLERYQDQARYIMIDEYQDTNPVQDNLADLLSAKYNNLCVVGDDDQSIYGWRGAEVRNILEFNADHVIKLEQNYRSTPVILKAANTVIRNNEERHGKELWSASQNQTPIELFHAPDEAHEAQAIVERLLAYRKEKGYEWSDMAILYRSNILSRPLEIALMQATWRKDDSWQRGIPYRIFGGLEFYERSEVKDLLSYLKVINNPRDQTALLRIINVPRRGISEKTLDLLTQVNRSKNIPLWDVLNKVEEYTDDQLNERAKKSVHNFVTIIEDVKDYFDSHLPSEAFRYLIERINYTKAIQDDVKSEKMREFKKENVEQLIASVNAYETENPNATINDFLGESMLDDNEWQRKKNRANENSLSLMTFHSSKGLEFPVCFLIGLEDQIMPHEKSLMETGLEEERRLMYVAMTRAKKYLTLSMAQKRQRFGKEIKSSPSRFLHEIPKELLKITSWRYPEITS